MSETTGSKSSELKAVSNHLKSPDPLKSHPILWSPSWKIISLSECQSGKTSFLAPFYLHFCSLDTLIEWLSNSARSEKWRILSDFQSHVLTHSSTECTPPTLEFQTDLNDNIRMHQSVRRDKTFRTLRLFHTERSVEWIDAKIKAIFMSRDMTKQTMWLCAQRRLRSAWASIRSDQCLRCALNV